MKKGIACQGNFSTRSWFRFGAFQQGSGGIFGGEGAFSRFGLFRAYQFLPHLSAYHKSKISITELSSISKRPTKVTIFDPVNLERFLLSLGNLQSLRRGVAKH